MTTRTKRVLFSGVLLAVTLAGVEGVSFVGWKILLGRATSAAKGTDTSSAARMDANLGTRLAANECTTYRYGLHDPFGSYVSDTPTWDLCTNSMGWRTPEFEEAKPPGTFRMVCMGDSHTMGQGVAAEQSFCSLLGERLAPLVAEAGLRLEVINAGVWGFSSYQGLIEYEKFVRAWSPDFVTVGYGANDRSPLERTGQAERDRMTFRLPGDDANGSALSYSDRDLNVVRLAKVAARSMRERRYLTERDTAAFDGETPFDQRRSSPVEYKENLARLLDRILEDGAQAVLIGVAIDEPVYRTLQREAATERGVPYLATWDRFEELEPAVRAGDIYREDRDVIESWMTEPGREMTGRWSRYVTIDGGHPNRIGHRIIAADLYELIAERVRLLAVERAAQRRRP